MIMYFRRLFTLSEMAEQYIQSIKLFLLGFLIKHNMLKHTVYVKILKTCS